jgi:flagellar assembly factor FliW
MHLHSTRFGTVDIDPDTVLEFAGGLIGLGGSRWALLSASADAAFYWLHSLDDPALALPVTDPRRFFADFSLELPAADAERLGVDAAATAAEVYVTVCAAPDPADTVANLRAPIVIHARRGVQVINQAPGMELRARLFPGAVTATASAA